jgi:putative restriction endonuclease
MSVKLVVAVTDGEWFRYLRTRPDLAEVNFWAPSATNFRALSAGELFLFKLHAPQNWIVGGGVFVHASTMPCSLAWETFGEANGAATLPEMRARIRRYRRAATDSREEFQVGCRILTQPFFLNESDWLPVPASWSMNIVTFKTFTTDMADGRQLWDALIDRVMDVPRPGLSAGPQARFGDPVPVRPRLGQGAFRVLVTDHYSRRCAITRERTLPALEAAHILPYGQGGEHEIKNGILMRRDIHGLFDLGYVTVTPGLVFEVSRRIKEEFENGRDYYRMHGTPVTAPLRSELRPDGQLLRWHNENKYRG